MRISEWLRQQIAADAIYDARALTAEFSALTGRTPPAWRELTLAAMCERDTTVRDLPDDVDRGMWVTTGMDVVHAIGQEFLNGKYERAYGRKTTLYHLVDALQVAGL